MGKYRKILVPVDGSESSLHALSEALKLARLEKCWLTALAVVPPYEGDLDLFAVGDVSEALRRPYEQALRKAEETARNNGGLVKTVLDEGEPYERILAVAQAENCDLIVTGRRGIRRRFQRVLMGSVTARVIGYSRIDVLVVPRQTTVGWKRILLPTDGSDCSRNAAAHAVDFAASYGGDLTAVSVVDLPEETRGEYPQVMSALVDKARGYAEEAVRRAEASGIKADVVVREGDVSQAICDLAKEIEADVVIMGSYGRTGLRRLLMGSTTEKVIGHAPCPVLVIRQ